MEFIKIIGIIAIIVFLVCFAGSYTIDWFVNPGETRDKIKKILGYVETGTLALSYACGIIHLFA